MIKYWIRQLDKMIFNGFIRKKRTEYSDRNLLTKLRCNNQFHIDAFHLTPHFLGHLAAQ